jgi:hypothetical protein
VTRKRIPQARDDEPLDRAINLGNQIEGRLALDASTSAQGVA